MNHQSRRFALAINLRRDEDRCSSASDGSPSSAVLVDRLGRPCAAVRAAQRLGSARVLWPASCFDRLVRSSLRRERYRPVPPKQFPPLCANVRGRLPCLRNAGERGGGRRVRYRPRIDSRQRRSKRALPPDFFGGGRVIPRFESHRFPQSGITAGHRLSVKKCCNYGVGIETTRMNLAM